MKEKNKKNGFSLNNLWWIIPSAVLLLLLTLFLLYPFFLKTYVRHKVSGWEKEYGMALAVGDLTVKHRNISLSQVYLIDTLHTDTVMHFDRLNMEIGYRRKGKWNPYPENIYLENLSSEWHLRKEIKDTSLKAGNRTPHFYETIPAKIDRALSVLTRYFPSHIVANRVSVNIYGDSISSFLSVDSFVLDNGRLSGNLILREGGLSTRWFIEGNADIEHDNFGVTFSLSDPPDPAQSFLFFKEKYDADLFFSRLDLRVHITHENTSGIAFSWGGSLSHPHFYHPKLTENALAFDTVSWDLQVLVTTGLLEIDSLSTISYNGFSIHPYLFFKNEPHKRIVFKMEERHLDAGNFFAAFPEGLFRFLPGLQVQGEMGFSIFLDCDFGNIDQLKLDFDLFSESLSLSGEGLGRIMQYNRDVEHTCRENGIPVRKIEISPANPDYIPFARIPFYLRDAILVSEDPSFFRHNGFVKSAVRDAMMVNLQRGRYSRGGSTLTMQLVKNLFLSKKKVASRKLEEILLVWLIESKHLISKERMFELYVNIIEWAPCVYGLSEASRFYFDKTPDLLTFGECVYLSTLIRAPKRYAGTLDAEGNVTDDRRNEMHFVAKKMFDRGMITDSQLSTFNSFVTTYIDEEKMENTRSKCNVIQPDF